MKDINIDDYKDYENVTIAEYVAAKSNVEEIAFNAAKNGNIIEAWHYAKIYFELSKLLDKRIAFGHKNGFDNKRQSR